MGKLNEKVKNGYTLATAAKKKVPIIFGIVTADTIEQAIERAGTKHGNKGRDAALSALEMASIYSQI